LKKLTIILILLALTFFSCEKEINIKLPESERKLVVEGSIEQNTPPFIMLTKTIDYFGPTDLTTLQNLFVHNATVTVSNGTNSVQLTEICTNQLPDSLLPQIAQLVSVSVADLKAFGLCLYTSLDTTIFGQIGKTYSLTIQAEGQTLTSSTTIPTPIPMNRFWYKDQPGYTNYGYLWFNQSDPPEYGNAYRIYTQRIGKDARFIPANGSVWNDQLINGLTFDAFIFRGHEPNSTNPDDFGDLSTYFMQGDTIAIKFCTIDLPHFEFWESFETASFNGGNPFAAPTTIKTNINGGLGIWGGYGVTYDTLIAVDL